MGDVPLFAVRAIVSHYDSSRADQPVLEFLRNVGMDTIHVQLRSGTLVQLALYLQQVRATRERIIGVRYTHPHETSESSRSKQPGLQHVAAVMATVDVRAAVDSAAAASSPEMLSACSVLESLLGSVSSLPDASAHASSTEATKSVVQIPSLNRPHRRRTPHRPSSHGPVPGKNSPLAAVNLRLRLCDTASHALAVVVRGNLIDKKACSDSLQLSTRLLVLASQLPPDSCPISTLRSAVETAALRVGAIAAFHVTIDPADWLRAAHTVLDLRQETRALFVPLFGGMLSSARPYADAKLDSVLTARAALALSTLLLAVDGEASADRISALPTHRDDEADQGGPVAPPTGGNDHDEFASWRAAAFQFLGERVVSIEGDGHGLPPSSWNVLDASHEYCRQAGEPNGLLGLVSSFMAASARQCIAETQAESDIVRPIGTSNLDDGESLPTGLTPRSEQWAPPADIFDLRSPTTASPHLLVSPSRASSLRQPGDSLRQPLPVDGGVHANAHREVGALCFDALSVLLDASTHRSDGSLPSFLAEREDCVSSIIAACDCVTRFSRHGALLLPFGANETSVHAPAHVEGSLSVSESTLVHAMGEFGDAVGDWFDRQGFSSLEWEDLAASVAGTGGPIDFGRKIFSSAPQDVHNQAIVEMYVSQFSLPVDQFANEVHSNPGRYIRSLFAATLSVSSLFTSSTTPAFLRLLLDAVGDSRRASAPVGEYDMYRAVVAVLLLTYAVRVVVDGEESASVFLCEVSDKFGFSELFRQKWDFEQTVETPRGNPGLIALFARIPLAVAGYIEHFMGDLWVPPPQAGAQELSSGPQRLLYLQLLLQLSVDVVANSRDFVSSSGGDVSAFATAVDIPGSSSTDSSRTKSRSEGVDKGQTFLEILLAFVEGTNEHGQGCFRAIIDACPEVLVESSLGAEEAFKLCLLMRKAVDATEGEVQSTEALADLRPLFECVSRTAKRRPFKRLGRIRELPSNSSRNLGLDSKAEQGAQASASDGPYTICDDEKASHSLGDGFRSHYEPEMRLVMSWVSLPTKRFYHELELAIAFLGARYGASEVSTVEILEQCLCDFIDAHARLQQVAHSPPSSMVQCAALAVDALMAPAAGSSVELSLRMWIMAVVRRAHEAVPEDAVSLACSALVAGCRYSRILSEATTSRMAMDSFVSVVDVAADESDLAGLGLALGVGEDCDSAWKAWGVSRVWAASIVERRELDEIVEMLLIPRDESAVCVDSSARSLRVLASACKSSAHWTGAVLESLARLFGASSVSAAPERFSRRLCRRSIVDSVTMSQALSDFCICLVQEEPQASAGRDLKWAELLYGATMELLRAEIAVLPLRAVQRTVEFSCVLAGLLQRRKEQTDYRDVEPFPTLVADMASLASSFWGQTAGSETAVSANDVVDKTVFLVGCLSAVRQKALRCSSATSGNLAYRSERKLSELVCDADESTVDAPSTSDSVTVDVDMQQVKAEDLSSKFCTFTSTGSQFVEQHWYFCYTCGLTGSEGVCVVCAQVCHAGHDLSYSRHSRFFCDCGATSAPVRPSNPLRPSVVEESTLSQCSGREVNAAAPPQTRSESNSNANVSPKKERVCMCLRPRAADSDSAAPSNSARKGARELRVSVPPSSHSQSWERIGRILPSSSSPTGTDEENSSEVPPLFYCEDSVAGIMRVFREAATVSSLGTVALGLLRLNQTREMSHFSDLLPNTDNVRSVDVDVLSAPSRSLYEVSRVAKAGTFFSGRKNAGINADDPNILKCIGSLVAFSSSGDIVAAAESKSKAVLRRVDRFYGPRPTDGMHLSSELGRLETTFEILCLRFNPESPRHLLACGRDGLSVFTIGSGGSVEGRVDVSLGLGDAEPWPAHDSPDDEERLRNATVHADWVRGSTFWLLVVTNQFVKIFDLGQDVMCPIYFAPAPASTEGRSVILDAVVCCSQESGKVMFVASSCGTIYRATLQDAEHGPVDLIPDEEVAGVLGGEFSGPISLGASYSPDLLWAVCADGSILVRPVQVNEYTRFVGAFSTGNAVSMTHLSSSPICMLVSSRKSDVAMSGILELSSSKSMRFEAFSGTLSSHIEGLFQIPARPYKGFPRVPSAALIMGDGSTHVLHLSSFHETLLNGIPTPDASAQGVRSGSAPEFGDITEDISVETSEQAAYGLCPRSLDMFMNPVPPVVGFTEGARIVSEDIVLSGDLKPSAIRSARLSDRGRISQGTGSVRDGFVGPHPQEPFSVVVECSDESTVLVGVRIQVGATDRSRTQSPGAVRVFGRALKWPIGSLQAKRWVDIPVTVPEAVHSPRKIVIELEPRRTADGSFLGDGSVAFDLLEVYGVRAVEFAERKRAFEGDVAKYHGRLRDGVSARRHLRISSAVIPRIFSHLVVGNDFYQQFDLFSATLASCMSVACDTATSLPLDLYLNLRAEVDGHDMMIAAQAFRRYWHSPKLLEEGKSLVAFEALLRFLCKECAVSSAEHNAPECEPSTFATARARLGSSREVVLKTIIAPQCEGLGVPMAVFRRSAAILAKVTEDVMRSGLYTCPNSDLVQRHCLLDGSDLERFCDSFLSMPRSQMVPSALLRETCANVVDIVFSALWFACMQAVRADIEMDGSKPQVRQRRLYEGSSVQCLVRLLCSPVALCRAFGYRRVVDLFQCVKTEGEDFVSVTPWFADTLPSTVPSEMASVEQFDVDETATEVTDDRDGDGDDSRWTFKCDICKKVCEPSWWHCAECADFDLCQLCVNITDPDLLAPHLRDHLLLRGLQDSLDATPYPTPSSVSPYDLVLCDIFRAIAGQLFSVLRGNEGEQMTGLRVLEAFQLVHRLVSPPTPPNRRALFLQALFEVDVGLLETLRLLLGVNEARDWGIHGVGSTTLSSGSSLPGSDRLAKMEVLYLLVRLVATMRDVALVPHLLRSGILPELSTLLDSLLPVVQQDALADGQLGLGATSTSPDRVDAESAFGDAGLLLPSPETEFMPVPLLRWDRCPVPAPTACSTVFGQTGPKHLSTPALEMVESLLDVLIGSLGSVAGPHLDVHKTCVSMYSLCGLAQLPGGAEGRGRETPTDASSWPNVENMHPTLYGRIGSKAVSLLRILCTGNISTVNAELDLYTLQQRVTVLRELYSRSGGFAACMEYDVQLKLSKTVSALYAVASKRPSNWQRYLMMEGEQRDGAGEPSGEDIACLLFGVVRSSTGETRLRAIHLVSYALDDPESDNFSKLSDIVSNGEPSNGDLGSFERPQVFAGHIMRFLTSNMLSNLQYIVTSVVLQGPDEEIRRAGGRIVQSALNLAVTANDVVLLDSLGEMLSRYARFLPAAGPRGFELTEALSVAVAASKSLDSVRGSPCKWVAGLGEQLSQLVRTSANLLSTHPNAHTYRLLSTIIAIDGYYLEAEPCMSCSGNTDEESRHSLVSLDSLRAEAKYTHKAIFCRLISRQCVSGVSIKVADPNRSRFVKCINIFHSMRTVADAAELKTKDHDWRKSASIMLKPGQTEARIELDIPLVAANIMFEFSEFYSGRTPSRTGRGLGAGARNSSGRDSVEAPQPEANDILGEERLQCPRCSRQVTDRYGICRSCGENSFQCRACRNIMYEVLDGFLCNECGYCKHGRFEFSLTCTRSYDAEPILCEADRKRALSFVEQEAEVVHKRYEELKALRASLVRLLSAPPGASYVDGNDPDPEDGADGSLPQPSIVAVEPASESSGNIDLLGMNMEALVRTLMGEDVGSAALPGAISLAGGSTGSSDVTASLRDIAGQLRREGASILEASQRGVVDEPDAPAEEVSSSQQGLVNGEAQISHQGSMAASVYGRDCKSVFTSMSHSIRGLSATREELVRHASKYRAEARPLRPVDKFHGSGIGAGSGVKEVSDNVSSLESVISPKCYGCTQAFVSRSLPLLEAISKQNVVTRRVLGETGFAVLLLRSGVLFDSENARDAARLLVSGLVAHNPQATSDVCTEITRKLEFCIDSYHSVDAGTAAFMELAVLRDTAMVEDRCWEDRLRMVFKLLFHATDKALESASVAEQVILPCLRAAAEMVQSPSHAPRSALDSSSSTDSSQPESGVNSEGMYREDIERPNSLRERGLGANSRGTESTSTGSGGNFVDTRLHGEDRGGGFDYVAGAIEENTGDCQNASSPHFSDRASTLADPPNDTTLLGAPGVVDFNVELNQLADMVENAHEDSSRVVDCSKWTEGEESFRTWINHVKPVPSASSSWEGITLRRLFTSWRVGVRTEPVLSESSDVSAQMSDISWALRLILKSPSSAVRSEACSLLESICAGEELLSLRLLDALLGESLESTPPVGPMAVEYFDLLARLVKPMENKLYLVAKGFLPRAAKIVEAEARRLWHDEVGSALQDGRLNLFDGFVLHRFVLLCQSVLEAVSHSPLAVREKVVARTEGGVGIVPACVRAYLVIRRLVSLRTKLTDQCQVVLRNLLSSPSYLCLAPSGEVVISACVAELQSAHEADDAQGVASLLDLLCSMLCPAKEEPTYRLILDKAPTQEEFIRGSMTREYYPSVEFDGPLMRDVKRKICQDLDLMSLLEDDAGDFGLELLVAGNLIKLDLPIASVYEHVWRGSAEAVQTQSGTTSRRQQALRRGRGRGRGRGSGPLGRNPPSRQPAHTGDPPMVVTYRLSGLDGEATEPIIDSLPDRDANALDPEEEFKATEVLGRVSGLPVLLRLLSVVNSWSDDAEISLREPALRLLRASCEVASNRSRLAALPGAVETLMDCVVSALERSHDSATAVESAESLSIATERILSEQTIAIDVAAEVHGRGCHIVLGKEQFGIVLGHLSVVASPKAEAALLHLLPYLMQGSKDALELSISHFAIGWESLDTSCTSQRAASQVSVVLNTWPKDAKGDSLASLLVGRGFADAAMGFLVSNFPQPKSSNVGAWESSLEAPGSSLALKVLRGLAIGLERDTGRNVVASGLRRLVVENGVLPLLCQLEQAVSTSGVGSAAEELVEALEKDELLQIAIENEHLKIRNARRAAAAASRVAAISSTRAVASPNVSTVSHGAVASSVSSPMTLAMLEGVMDEVGPACVVCGDGFTSRPEEALGVYVLSRRVNLSTSGRPLEEETCAEDAGSSRSSQRRSGGLPFPASIPPSEANAGVGRSSRQPSSSNGHYFTNVTHYNAIHLNCHRESARADRSTRQPRDEWDGAALRNSQTKCNNIFPLKPPSCFSDESDPVVKDGCGPSSMGSSSYEATVDYFFGRLASFTRSSASQSVQISRDIAHSISRCGLGKPAVFAEHAKGGGPHSNICLIPHLLQLAWHVMATPKSGVDDCPSLEELLAGPVSGQWDMFPGDLSYALALSLVLHSVAEWKEFVKCLVSQEVTRNIIGADARFVREIAFVDTVQRHLKGDPSVIGNEWKPSLSRRIAVEEEWLAKICAEVTEHWETRICLLLEIVDLEVYLAEK